MRRLQLGVGKAQRLQIGHDARHVSDFLFQIVKQWRYFRLYLSATCKFDRALHHRERRLQLMRRIGSEVAEIMERALETSQQTVDRPYEALQFTIHRANLHALCQLRRPTSAKSAVNGFNRLQRACSGEPESET